MERVSHSSQNLRLRLILITTFWVIAILVVMPLLPLRSADAGTAFAPPEPVKKMTDANVEQEFPDSKFGQPPSRVSPRDSFAARENFGSKNQDDEDSDSSGGRSPASTDTVSTRPSTASPATPASSTAGDSEDAASSAVPEVEKSAIRRKGVQEVSIIAGDLGFFPKTFFVSRDVPVRLYITGASKQALCIMMDSFQVRKQVRSQKIEEITFTPNQPGTYRFYCPVNGMEGSMVVKELVSSQ